MILSASLLLFATLLLLGLLLRPIGEGGCLRTE